MYGLIGLTLVALVCSTQHVAADGGACGPLTDPLVTLLSATPPPAGSAWHGPVTDFFMQYARLFDHPSEASQPLALVACIESIGGVRALTGLSRDAATRVAHLLVSHVNNAALVQVEGSGSGSSASLVDAAEWRALGPLNYGKTEYDGDSLTPLAHPAVAAACGAGPLGDRTGLTVNCIDHVALAAQVLKSLVMVDAGFQKLSDQAGAKKRLSSALSESALLQILTDFAGPKGAGVIRGYTAVQGSPRAGASRTEQVAVDYSAVVQNTARMLQSREAMEHIAWASARCFLTCPTGGCVVETAFTGVHTLMYTRSDQPGRVYPVAADQYGRQYTFTFTVDAVRDEAKRASGSTIVLTFFVRLRGAGQLHFTSRVKLLKATDGAPAVKPRAPLFIPDLLAPSGQFFTSTQALQGLHDRVAWVPVPVSVRMPSTARRVTRLEVATDASRTSPGLCVSRGCFGDEWPTVLGEFVKAKGCDGGSPLERVDASQTSDFQRALHNATTQLALCEEATAILSTPMNTAERGDSVFSPVFIGPTGMRPDQTLPVRIPIGTTAKQQLCAGGRESERVTLRFRGVDDQGAASSESTIGFNIRCRKLADETFVFTFLDRDGTISSAAARPPLPGGKAMVELTSAHPPAPVVLSQHGTGVSASSQADSYKLGKKSGKGFTFGVGGAWVVAPDRHGAHNWEGVGRHTALAALFYAADASRSVTVASQFAVADERAVIYAGHSMGGHGALHLAVLDPDRAIAVMLLAGWISKEHYGGSNDIFGFDRSTAHTDGRLRGVIEASISDNTPDIVVANIAHLPVFVRVGAEDTTVAPYYSRRVRRLLVAAGVTDITLDEVAGQGHWWWDTQKPNDGGCMNDQAVRAFMTRVVKAHYTSPAGGDDVPGSVRWGSRGRRSLATVSLAHAPCAAGVCIERQVAPQQLSSVELVRTLTTDESGSARCTVHIVNAQNVARLRVSTSLAARCTVAGSSTTGKRRYKPQVIHPLDDGGCGGSLADAAVAEKSCEQGTASSAMPPFRVHMETPFLVAATSSGFVQGQDSAAAQQRWLDAVATYVANTHFVAYDSFVPVVTSQSPSSDGGPRSLLQLVVQPPSDEASPRGTVKFAGHARGGAPYGHVSATWTVASTDERGLHHGVLEIGMPTVPPMMRPPFGNLLPPFVESDARLGHMGFGSFTAAGYVDDEKDETA